MKYPEPVHFNVFISMWAQEIVCLFMYSYYVLFSLAANVILPENGTYPWKSIPLPGILTSYGKFKHLARFKI